MAIGICQALISYIGLSLCIMSFTDFRAEALKLQPSMSQTVAKKFAEQKLLKAGIMFRCLSAYDLLPEIHCVIFKVPALTNPESSIGLTSSVAAVRSLGIPLILWTEEGGDIVDTVKSAVGIQSLEVCTATTETCILDTFRLVEGGSSVLWVCVQSRALHTMVQNVQAKLGPALYYGDHQAALACSAVGVAYGDAPDAATAASSAISLSERVDGLLNLGEWKAIAMEVKYHPVKASGGRCSLFCVACIFGIQGICCACRCCPCNPDKRAEQDLAALSNMAKEAPAQETMGL